MQGDATVIKYLNDALAHELTAVNQYWLHYRLQDDWGLTAMAAKSRAESIEEMEHADKLIARILFLGGSPSMAAAPGLKIGRDPLETLENDLAAEQGAVALYKEARGVCEKAGDFVSMQLFEALLADEEGHVGALETQIDLHRRIGAERYAQLNAAAIDSAE